MLTSQTNAMRTMFVALIMLACGLAGCVEDPNFDASFTVDSVSVADDGDGFCGYGEDEECHSVEITIENVGDSEFSTNMFYWEAVTSSGGIYDAPSVDGPDACAGGSTCQVTLDFDISNGETITMIKWDDMIHQLEASA